MKKKKQTKKTFTRKEVVLLLKHYLEKQRLMSTLSLYPIWNSNEKLHDDISDCIVNKARIEDVYDFENNPNIL